MSELLECCGKTFKSKSAMKRHQAWHRGDDRAPDITPVAGIESLDGTKTATRLDNYKLQAEQLADQLGHALEPWIDHDRWADTKCSICRRVAAVAENPPPGTGFTSGLSTTEKCV